MTTSVQNSLNLKLDLCSEHNINHSDICLSESCNKRWLCHVCKLKHPENHLRNIFSLSEIKSGDFLSHIDHIITDKQKTLLEKTRDKPNLLRKINTIFFDIQNEIEKILIDTKTEIIHNIERLYQDLSLDYNEEYFIEIKKSLLTLGEDLKKQDIGRISSNIEHFSSIYSQTLNSINYGLHLTSKFDDQNLDFPELIDLVKSSCNGILERTCDELKESPVSRIVGKEIIKTAPQEITCMEHCSNLGLFATGGSHGLLTLWDDKTFNPVSQVQLHDSFINLASYLSTNQTLITASKDNTIGMTQIQNDGTVSNWNKIKTHKMIRHLVSIENETKIATISNQGSKIRIWGTNNQDLTYLAGINVPVVSHTSKLFYIAKDNIIGVTYDDCVKMFSLSDGGFLYNLIPQGQLISCCYHDEYQTIHAIASSQNQNQIKYEEVIWKESESGEFAIWNKREFPRLDNLGKPIEILSNPSVVAIIFSSGFTLSKTDSNDGSLKFITYLAQSSSTENQKPALMMQNEMKLMLTGDMKKIKIYTF